MIDYGKKGYKIAVFALVLALLAFSISGIPGTPGINGTNGVSSDVVTYYLHQGGVMNLTTNFTSPLSSITITAVNGFTLIGNWTTPSINSTLIPAGEHTLHYHAFKTSTGGNHVDDIVFECFLLYNNGTVKQSHGFSEQHSLTTAVENEGDINLPMGDIPINTTDKWKISIYINQTGTGSNPSIRFDFDDQTDAAFRLPRLIEDNDTAYVNKSGDNWTGVMFGHFSNTTNSIDIAGGAIVYTSSNSTTGLTSTITIDPSNIVLEVTNGTNNAMLMNENITTFQKNVSLDNNSLVNCANCMLKTSDYVLSNTASNFSYFNITGLNINRFQTGKVYIRLNAATAATVYVNLYVNNDTNVANYSTQYMLSSGAAVSAGQTGGNIDGISNYEGDFIDGEFSITPDGTFRWTSINTRRDASNVQILTITLLHNTPKQTNISSIQICAGAGLSCDGTNGFLKNSSLTMNIVN